MPHGSPRKPLPASNRTAGNQCAGGPPSRGRQPERNNDGLQSDGEPGRTADREGALKPVFRTLRATARTAVFFLKVLPMLPSRFVDHFTGQPVRERVTFASTFGEGEGDLYRPSKPGVYPGVVVCLGVIPFGFDHPQIPRLGAALAQAGFSALLYQSPRMQDFVLDPEDIGNLAAAHDYLTRQPFVHKEKSGLLGTCVGGAFALMAAAHPAIRDHVQFVATFAPFASMQNLVPEIASSTRMHDNTREPWQVDPLTRKVLVHCLTDVLERGEADKLREMFDNESGIPDASWMSGDAVAIRSLLTASDYERAVAAFHQLPAALPNLMEAISPILYLQHIRAGLVTIGHDRDDLVIPVGQSRSLVSAWGSRPGLRYTEFGMFQHADPTTRKLGIYRRIREFGKFFGYVYPIFREVA